MNKIKFFGEHKRFSGLIGRLSEVIPTKLANAKVENWNSEFENIYWDRNHESNPKELCGKLHALQYFKNVQLLHKVPEAISDVGGGVNGGVLPLLNAKRKDLFDPLKPILSGIDSHGYLADAIPDKFSNYDVVFCLEALDHCSDSENFYKSLERVCGLVKSHGLLFFEIPIRKSPVNGHPVSLKDFSRQAIKNFIVECGFILIDGYDYGPNFNSPRSFGIVALKS
ncbi:MAG: hypothetical protein ACON5K_10720 [Bacteroidia bacterium]